ncbi:MAG TPA: glucose 1-dehydrogenase [Burkholderiales bacterium]|nr:glucose 1-dehydrogenase [Burkholderiales bacterium]
MTGKSERRTALVTGASYGLGQATAVALAKDGYDVAVTELRVEELSDTLDKIKAAGGRGVPVALDLRVMPSVEKAMADAVSALGRVDVLVNNAGVTVRKLALDVTREEWDEVINVNLKGSFFMSQQMGRHLVATKRPGCVISIASTHGTIGFTQRTTYGISKAGIIHMTRMLAYEWAEYGIRVNAVAPGTVATKTRAAYFDANPAARKAMVDRVPLGRFGEPEEVAGAVRYLASPEAAYVTGQTLLLDGGLTSY